MKTISVKTKPSHQRNKSTNARADSKASVKAEASAASGLKRRLFSHAPQVLTQLGIIALPVIFSLRLWREIWSGVRSRAWDGTGHFAVAQIYSQSIFPETLGWTQAYFGGMPLPNFYPPLFYWLVALLSQTHLLSFAAAFKLMVVMPMLLLPSALWLLGWSVSNRSHMVATAAALASVPLLSDARFNFVLPAGLDYLSTFQIGLYTQPLGFVLLIAWYVCYASARQRRLQFLLSSILLALTVLANFFNAMAAAIFILTTLVSDTVAYARAPQIDERRAARQTLLAHLASPLVALCLTAFWLVPMLSQYQYFVTRPLVIEASLLVTKAFWVWYALAVIGSIIWLRRPTSSMMPYLSACLILAVIVLAGVSFAPHWFPLQSPRFLATLNFLLAVPVAYALAAAFRGLARLLGEISARKQALSLRRTPYTAGVAVAAVLLFVFTSPGTQWTYAFYPAGEREGIDGVLGFARDHADGRYLVEVINPQINPAYTEASFDTRAINSYLGAQGNETLSTVFHEASPSALFTLPAINSLSSYQDAFGISSVLADDMDYAAQPLARHLERARALGVKYLVIRTPQMKEKLAQEAAIASRSDFGWWTVYQLHGEPLPQVRALSYRPALVASSFTVKARRRNEWSFMRLAEEQFADNWFDVLLVRAPELRLDRLKELEHFGALIVESYDYDDESAAFETLRRFAKERPLILLSSDDPLFQRVRSAARDDFPRLEIIERPSEEPGQTLEALQPAFHYNESAIRQRWAAIRAVLERNKIAVDSGSAKVGSETTQNSIQLRLAATQAAGDLPVTINTTYHPNWRRDDGATIYAATPFNMLTFVGQSIHLRYQRRAIERAGLWISASTLLLLCLFNGWHYTRRLAANSRRQD